MDCNDLRKLVASGVRPVVEFGEDAEELETYACPGMRCRVTAVDMADMGCVRIHVDYSEFESFNATFESHTYYDKNGSPRLTAKEAGLYEAVDSIYVTDGDQAGTLALVEDDASSLRTEYAQSGVTTSYTSWLEAEVLRPRSITS